MDKRRVDGWCLVGGVPHNKRRGLAEAVFLQQTASKLKEALRCACEAKVRAAGDLYWQHDFEQTNFNLRQTRLVRGGTNSASAMWRPLHKYCRDGLMKVERRRKAGRVRIATCSTI